MTASSTHSLLAQQAEALLAVEQRVERAKGQLDLAEADRQKLRERYRARLPLGVEIEVAGIRVKVSIAKTGARFAFAAYIKAGHKLTAAMRDFYSEPGERDAWLVRPGAERKAIGAR